MTTPARLELAPLTEWIRRVDDHAEARIALLGRTAQILDGPCEASKEERRELAEKLERWRYQHLSARGARFGDGDQRLLDALDEAARRLSGRPAQPPRRTRELLGDESLAAARIAEASELLDPSYPLEALVDEATALTVERFGDRSSARVPGCGRRMLLYAPLYLSNHCINHCRYCGFRHPLPLERVHLTLEEAKAEAEILIGRGFRHLLLLGGDFPRLTTPEYYAQVIEHLRERGVSAAVEIAPQSTAEYETLVRAGACGVTLYQETYDADRYAGYHPRGTKAAYDWRFEGPDRAGEAGMGRLGLGILLGLADPIEDFKAMMRHAAYLHERYPDRTIAFSLPRIHEAPDDFEAPFEVDDELFIRMYCVLRMAFPDSPLVLSTREKAELRDRLATICITQMSAGSSTAPGGYQCTEHESLREQFPVTDHRPVETVAEWLGDHAFQLTWEISSR
ncbi:MAG: radical SAM protein [Thermoguttaceae bacterium]